MKNNQQLTPSFKKALATLNALPRKKGKGRELTRADLLSVDQVVGQELSSKKAFCNPSHWDDESVFIQVSVAVELYKSLTSEGQVELAHYELIGGWFDEHDNLDDADDDGHYCSTPCHDEEIPTHGQFRDALIDCAAPGLAYGRTSKDTHLVMFLYS
jgi:hypothetical protein